MGYPKYLNEESYKYTQWFKREKGPSILLSALDEFESISGNLYDSSSPNRDEFKEASKNFTQFDVGVYYPLKGVSNNELASMASSQHLCQGFGRLTTRGAQTEYVEFLKGEAPKDKNDIFSGINTTWNRVKNGGEVGDILYDIEENFDFTNPVKHIPKLLEAYSLINKLEDEHWKRIKITQIKEIIAACIGLYLEASAVSSSAVPNSKIDVNFELINRSKYPIELISIQPSTSDKNIYKGISFVIYCSLCLENY